MILTQDVVLRIFFRKCEVLHPEYLPVGGPVLLAPTHRSRWDALLLPMAAGRRVNGRDCRFMVTRTEMLGLQGWFLSRLGCFPVDQDRPSLTALRYAVDLLADGQQVVVFPEGRINQSDGPISLMPGLIRLAQLAFSQGVSVRLMPVGIAYSEAVPHVRSRAAICFGQEILVQKSGREEAKRLTCSLCFGMRVAEQVARNAVGRPLLEG
ncbi:1-acyl-sn-glycerol-3-phosphate acyltransferase [cyanobiont of Ornithocercus magnificus]|nr:1-acyl-sn-glycerol-3-phosphate acyltransferase [cyanobiont of Ornithocercus magnificus]